MTKEPLKQPMSLQKQYLLWDFKLKNTRIIRSYRRFWSPSILASRWPYCLWWLALWGCKDSGIASLVLKFPLSVWRVWFVCLVYPATPSNYGYLVWGKSASFQFHHQVSHWKFWRNHKFAGGLVYHAII